MAMGIKSAGPTTSPSSSSGYGTAIGAGVGAAATMISASMAKKDKKREMAEIRRQHEIEMGTDARKFASEKESEANNREGTAINNMIEGLRKSLRR